MKKGMCKSQKVQPYCAINLRLWSTLDLKCLFGAVVTLQVEITVQTVSIKVPTGHPDRTNVMHTCIAILSSVVSLVTAVTACRSDIVFN